MSVNWRRPYEGKGGRDGQWDFVRQDGIIYAWYESNFQYEYAWWLRDPDVVEIHGSQSGKSLRVKLLVERPLPPGKWVRCRGRDLGATSDG